MSLAEQVRAVGKLLQPKEARTRFHFARDVHGVGTNPQDCCAYSFCLVGAIERTAGVPLTRDTQLYDEVCRALRQNQGNLMGLWDGSPEQHDEIVEKLLNYNA